MTESMSWRLKKLQEKQEREAQEPPDDWYEDESTETPPATSSTPGRSESTIAGRLPRGR